MREDISVMALCLTYNHEDYLEDTLKGFVMQQTDFRFVAVVIDDASTDKTADVLRRYERQYPDVIKAIYLTENHYSQKKPKLPYYKQWQDEAKYLAICEGDDYWTDPFKLQKQVSFLENNPEYGLCFTDYSTSNQDHVIIQESCFANGKHRSADFKDHLLSQGYIAPMTWLYRNDVWQTIKTPIPFIDHSFAMALEFFQNSKVGYLSDNTAVHIVHKDSACHQADPVKNFHYRYDVFKEQLFFAEKYAPELINNISVSQYIEMLPDAISLCNVPFLKEAETFFASIGLDYNIFRSNAEYILSLRRDAQMARNSYAYRLGATLLKPFKQLVKNRK